MAFAVIPYNEDKVLMNIKCIEDAFNITSRLSIKDIFDMIKYNFNIKARIGTWKLWNCRKKR